MYDVRQARSRLGADLNELEHQIKSQLDWRVQFRRYPWAFLGAAFGLALLATVMLRAAIRRREPVLR
jgi:hypothetical protein